MRFLSGTALLLLSMAAAQAQTTFFGPTPYLQQSDTPENFANGPMHLEDFEDQLVHPDLSFLPAGEFVIQRPSPIITDSVDLDDGLLDGFVRQGHSGAMGATTFNFTVTRINFAAPFPQAAGVVLSKQHRGPHALHRLRVTTAQLVMRERTSPLRKI